MQEVLEKEETVVGSVKTKGKEIVYEYSFEIPEDLKIYDLPKDINEFITQFYKCLEDYIKLRLADKQLTTEVLTEFVLYMLESGKNGVSRWKGYDKVKYPNHAYHMWFLKYCHYFILKYFNAKIRENKGKLAFDELEYDNNTQSHTSQAKNLISLSVCTINSKGVNLNEELNPEALFVKKETENIINASIHKIK